MCYKTVVGAYLLRDRPLSSTRCTTCFCSMSLSAFLLDTHTVQMNIMIAFTVNISIRNSIAVSPPFFFLCVSSICYKRLDMDLVIGFYLT